MSNAVHESTRPSRKWATTGFYDNNQQCYLTSLIVSCLYSEMPSPNCCHDLVECAKAVCTTYNQKIVKKNRLNSTTNRDNLTEIK